MVKVRYDKEGDFLEITSKEKEGFFKDLGKGVFKRVDKSGNMIGFAILNVRKRSRKEIDIPFGLKFKEKASA